MIEQPKLCKDCRYCLPARTFKPSLLKRWRHGAAAWRLYYDFAKCTHAVAQHGGNVDLVSGERRPVIHSGAWQMRADYSPCGEDAKLFEPKESGNG